MKEGGRVALLDAFGRTLALQDDVHYAGRDYRNRPTINLGYIDDMDIEQRKVRVVRRVQRNHVINDTYERRVWVEVAKVGRING